MTWRFYFLCLSLFILSLSHTFAAAPIPLRGHLSRERTTGVTEKIEKTASGETVILEIGSRSGDLTAVLDIAKALYEVKRQKDIHIVMFIDDEAIGPVAILPFLADELYTSLFVSWGDIPAGAETEMSTNLLRSRVMSLISASRPSEATLRLLADAMIDPTAVVVSEKGVWRIARDGSNASGPIISLKGQTLVVNQDQLRELGLVKGVLSLSDFHQRMKIVDQDTIPVTDDEAVAAKAAEERLAEHIKFDAKGENRIGYITINDKTAGISESTWLYVKWALDYYKTHKPRMIILELNTPGGQVYASQKISDALYAMDKDEHVPVVAFVNNWAISAGAMLAYSCRFIATVKDGAMGAAEPVLATQGGGMEAASEKVNSALRTDFGNRAAFFGRDPQIAQAMVDKDIVLVLRHGKVTKLNSDTDIKTTGPYPDEVITKSGKLLTLSGEEMIHLGVADVMVPRETLEPLTAAEERRGEWPSSKSLLFQQAFFKALPPAQIDAYRMDWKGQFFAFLTHPAVASLLFLGLMLGVYVEISTPGFGIAGSVAVICLILMGLSSFALEAAGWLELILILLGVAIITVDLFFLPTFGILGTAGAIFLLAGVMGLLLPGLGSVSYDLNSQTLNAAGEVVLERLAWLAGAFVVGLIVIAFLAQYIMPQMKIFLRLALRSEESAKEGFVAGLSPEEMPLVGATGTASSTLRPAGKVVIEGRLYDAVSSGTFIEKGASIQIVAIDGARIIVDLNPSGDQKIS